MGERRRRLSSKWSQAAVTVALLLVVAGAYLLTMYLTVDRLTTDSDTSLDERDSIYLWMHLGFITGATVVGFAAGKLLNGLGFAFATLFFASMFGLMVLGHVGSHALACDGGRNDVFRHWTC
ncbi:MAG: hypothetical protein HY875_05370 [Chloroflexi bacterium]|nr:hypothetical protein [Chloroflexota bacterium]